MKTIATSSSKEVKPKSRPLSDKSTKTPSKKASKPAPPKPVESEEEEEEESPSDLENEVLEEDAHNDLVDSASDDDDELLEGFESESDAEERVEELNLPSPPTNREKKLAKKAAKSAAAQNAASTPKTPGTIYLGRIPHGFFEPQMHSYFSQFGTITRLRLARNRRTGKSKHFAYVEFVSKDVAEVVAETMDGYLIPPHQLVCQVVEVEEKVWKGANSVFRKIPWAKINRERLEGKRSRAQWEELAKREEERKIKRAEKIRAAGIEYEFPAGGKKRKGEDEVLEEVVKSKKTKTERAKESLWEEGKSVDESNLPI